MLRDAPTSPQLDFTAAVLAVDEATLWDTLASQTNTTPGPDGIPFQAYLPFGMEVVKVLRDLLLEIAASGVCMESLKEGSPRRGARQRTTSGPSRSLIRHIVT